MSAQPERIGRYELLGELARGGMGAVYRARDLELGREVAIKVITTPLDPEALGRFQLEGEAAARVSHPNVLQVHERGVHQGRPYLVMDLAAGSLRERLRKGGALPGAEAARLLAPIAEALGELHAAQILHRDLKPENILLSHEGAPLLADFGIARAVDRETRYTQSGVLIGTPAYMAPEQASGEALDARVDVYGLGAVLYELVTGRPPFAGGTVMSVLDRVMSEPPMAPSQISPGLEPWVEALVLRCLEKNPAERWQDMAELAQALRTGVVQRRKSPRLVLWGVFLAALGILGLGGALAWSYLPSGAPSAASPSPTPAERLIVRALGPSSPEGLREVEVRLEPPEARTRRLELLREGAPQGFVEVEPGRPTRVTLRCEEPGLTTWRFVWGESAAEIQAECPNHPRWYLERASRPPLLPGLRPAPQEGDFRNEIDGSLMRWIPPDEALMQDAVSAKSARVTTGFYLGKFEVTHAQYQAYLRWQGVEITEKPKHRFPMQVDFHGATRYARWAEGRLPTILEWNLAAFGPYGALRTYSWGEASPNPKAHDIQTEGTRPSPVQRPRDISRDGVHGLGGGLVEWAADVSPRPGVTELGPDHATPSIPAPKRDSGAPERGRLRGVCGSSFRHDLVNAKNRFQPDRPASISGNAFLDQGFRLVRSPTRPEPEHLEWQVQFRKLEDPARYMRLDVPGPTQFGELLGPAITTKVLRDPWLGVIPAGPGRDGFGTFARCQLELPPGRWVFSILDADDGVRLRVRARKRVLAEVDEWRPQVIRHLEAIVEVSETTALVVEVEHCELLDEEGLWVELSRE